jgi:electron transport complex protein RnfB
MPSEKNVDRRRFLVDTARVAGAVAFSGAVGYLAGSQGRASESRWQIDPDKCIGCGNCATYCVLDESAVKCVQCFDMCGYCDICTGYFDTNYQAVDTAAENQLCPTGALIRNFIEEKSGQRFYEYTIDLPLCIGCGICVKGCALMNGSLYLQVMHDRCVDCNECAIAVACPSQAFDRIPIETPYRLKNQAMAVIQQKAEDPQNVPARELLNQVYQP